MVRWPEEANEKVIWAEAFPVPDAQKLPATKPPGDSDEDDYDDEYSDFWFSPRMAALLHHAGCLYADQVLELGTDEIDEFTLDDLPGVAHTYARKTSWALAYREAARRLVARLGKGQEPQPNCTAEEMALHKIIELAQDMYSSEDESIMDTLQDIPRSKKDEDFDMVSDVAFQDHDVLMLFDMPGAVLGNGPIQQMMDFANLHPDEWFKPFKSERVNDHVH
jgi:hypothetical protein